MHILVKNKKLIFNDYRIKCALGKRGIGKKKREGDYITPIGMFKIKFVFYRKDRIKKLNTKLRKFPINRSMGWCNDSRSKKYNKLITIPFKYKYERFYKKENIYDIILVLNYNMNPIKKKLGSAIFIHIAKNNYKATEGCVAIKKNKLLWLLKNINTKTKIKII